MGISGGCAWLLVVLWTATAPGDPEEGLPTQTSPIPAPAGATPGSFRSWFGWDRAERPPASNLAGARATPALEYLCLDSELQGSSSGTRDLALDAGEREFMARLLSWETAQLAVQTAPEELAACSEAIGPTCAWWHDTLVTPRRLEVGELSGGLGLGFQAGSGLRLYTNFSFVSTDYRDEDGTNPFSGGILREDELAMNLGLVGMSRGALSWDLYAGAAISNLALKNGDVEFQDEVEPAPYAAVTLRYRF